MLGLKTLALAMAAVAVCITTTHQQVTTTCVGQLDIVFMVDASNSVLDHNFQRQMDSLRLLTNSLDVRPEAIRVGSIIFSTTVSSASISGNKRQVLNDISQFEYLDESTRTDLGLERAMLLFQNAPRDSIVPKLLMVITDGASTMPERTLAVARQAKASGISIYAIGITDAINEAELRNLASSPNQVMLTPNFQNLNKVLLDGVRQACTSIVIPTLPPVVTQPPVVNNLCSASGSMNGRIGFVAHPSKCDMYIQCYYNPATGYHLGVVRHCPIGLHYNPSAMVCDWPEKVNCANDPCRAGCKAYPVLDSSRAYWTCKDGRSTAMCCGPFQTFVYGKGCVNDTWCKEPCKIGDCAKGQCLKRPLWNQDTSYKYTMTPSSTVFLPGFCRYNSLDMVTCGCTSDVDHYCRPDFETTFNNANSMGEFITATGVIMNGRGGASLNSNGRMRLNLHKTMGYEPLTISMQYVDNSPLGQNGQILMSSSNDCNEPNGDLLVIYTQNYINAKLTASNGQSTVLNVPTNGLGVNSLMEMTLTYDHRYLTLSIKAGNVQFVETTKAPMGISFPCGIDIGPTNARIGFTGVVRKLSLYSCVPRRLY